MSKPKYFYTLDDKTIAYADGPTCLTINQEIRGTERLVFLDRDALLSLRTVLDTYLNINAPA